MTEADNHHEWLKFAPRCMSDAQWEVAAKTREAVLSHRTCPWGGHLIKVDCKSIFIQNAPEDPSTVLVRPEVRAMCHTTELRLRCVETYAPGHVLVERSNSMFILRLTAVLFGRGCEAGFWYAQPQPVIGHNCLRRNCPESGDAAYFGLGAVLIMRPHPETPSRYRAVLVFRTVEDRWPAHLLPIFPAFTHMFHISLDRLLNGPTMRDLRELDAKFYLILTLRGFNRGNPLLPRKEAGADDETLVLAGEHLGVKAWTRFNPGHKFQMKEYLRCFMKNLGYQLSTYDVMDGRKLVRYQCVVVRHEWEQLKDVFFEAFRAHKAAYRHANGGSTAPGLVEDVRPHWAEHACDEGAQPEAIKTVVCKTFVELDEGSSSGGMSMERRNSTGEVTTFFV